MPRYYAGIGSRDITDAERETILELAGVMAKKDFIVYSGNAPGSDVTFQEGSGGNCVIFLPWNGFGLDLYHYKQNSKAYYIVGDSKEGLESTRKYHPNYYILSRGAKALMNRNHHQVFGYDIYPKVEFVVCCADPKKSGHVSGGTGQAVRIALDNNIPVVNIRTSGWRQELSNLI
jgi:hypothetical protein